MQIYKEQQQQQKSAQVSHRSQHMDIAGWRNSGPVRTGEEALSSWWAGVRGVLVLK